MDDLYLSWTILSESKTRFDGLETLVENCPKRPFRCLVGHVRCTWFSPACFLDQSCDVHLLTCLLDSLKNHVQVTSCLMFLHGKEMSLCHGKEMSLCHGRESVIQLTTCLLILSFLADSSYADILSFINLWSSWASSLSPKPDWKFREKERKMREKTVRNIGWKIQKKSGKRSDLGRPFLTILWLKSVSIWVVKSWRFGVLKLKITHVLQPLILIGKDVSYCVDNFYVSISVGLTAIQICSDWVQPCLDVVLIRFGVASS